VGEAAEEEEEGFSSIALGAALCNCLNPSSSLIVVCSVLTCSCACLVKLLRDLCCCTSCAACLLKHFLVRDDDFAL
jgi:hypothetical protein